VGAVDRALLRTSDRTEQYCQTAPGRCLTLVWLADYDLLTVMTSVALLTARKRLNRKRKTSASAALKVCV
jgi:hypothetical protein